MEIQKFLIPCYLEKFKCTGSLCEDTCCNGWKVFLDKKTYKNYKKYLKKDDKISLHHIALNKEKTNNYEYGYIKMMEDGNCPYLSEEKLCHIQSHLGEKWLSYTCYSYPRVVNKVNGIYEMSGSLSCPEVARLTLLNKEPMEFKDFSLNVTQKYIASVTIEDSSAFDENIELMSHFWPLRIFTITTLQDRRYNIEERLILLGLVYKKIIQLSENNELRKTVEIMENYSSLFNDVSEMKNLLSSKKDSKELLFSEKFIREFDSLKGSDFYTATNYLDMVKNIIEGLGIKNNEFDFVKDNYLKSYEEYYFPYMKKKEYVLENYLVNEIFKELYPFAKTESIYSSYKMLLTLHNITKFHLIGVSSYYQKLDDSIVVNTIQAFSKAILHHKNYLNIFSTD